MGSLADSDAGQGKATGAADPARRVRGPAQEASASLEMSRKAVVGRRRRTRDSEPGRKRLTRTTRKNGSTGPLYRWRRGPQLPRFVPPRPSGCPHLPPASPTFSESLCLSYPLSTPLLSMRSIAAVVSPPPTACRLLSPPPPAASPGGMAAAGSPAARTRDEASPAPQCNDSDAAPAFWPQAALSFRFIPTPSPHLASRLGRARSRFGMATEPPG